MNALKDIAKDFLKMGKRDYWELQKEERYEVLAAWLEDRFFNKNYSPLRAFEIISERTGSDDLPRLLIEIASGKREAKKMYEKMMENLEQDYGNDVAVDFVEMIDHLRYFENEEQKPLKKLNHQLSMLKHTGGALNFISGGIDYAKRQ